MTCNPRTNLELRCRSHGAGGAKSYESSIPIFNGHLVPGSFVRWAIGASRPNRIVKIWNLPLFTFMRLMYITRILRVKCSNDRLYPERLFEPGGKLSVMIITSINSADVIEPDMRSPIDQCATGTGRSLLIVPALFFNRP